VRRAIATIRQARSAIAALALCAIAAFANAQVILESVEDLEGVGVVDMRGESVDRSLAFTNWRGDRFTLDSQFDGERPVVLLLAYYDCPLLCDLMLDAAKTALAELDQRPGRDYRVLVVSIDHTNTTEQAKQKRDAFIAGFDPLLSDSEGEAVVFATSQAEPVRALANQVGYIYRYLPENGEFAHPPAIMFLKPDGTVHTTLMGIGTKAKQVELALNDASDGRTASFFEEILFSCYDYDPKTGKFTPAAMNIMRLGASGVAVLLAVVIGGLFIFNRGSTPPSDGSHDLTGNEPVNAYHAGKNPV
jgi:protein SCO1/2